MKGKQEVSTHAGCGPMGLNQLVGKRAALANWRFGEKSSKYTVKTF